MSDTTDLRDWEEKAEAAYTRMYEVSRYAAKGEYEDASQFLYKAIEEAKRLGLADEAARLTARKEHIRAVFNSQFRWL